MLEDVLSALIRARTISAIWVVTPTPQLAELALRMGARCLRQPQPIDLNSAFAQALTAVAAFDPDAGVALLPGDLPLLTAADIDGAAALSLKSPALLAANRDGGTGLILLWNPGALTPDFGGASFARHSDQLRRSGQAVGDVEMAGFALDLDEPRDFAEVMRRAPGSHTAVFLRMALRGDAP